jgi:sporulation protein YlmC with PRC-barrel domain
MKIAPSFKLVSGVVAGLIAISTYAAESKGGRQSVRASSIKGAAISFQGGGNAGTVQDVILDPETGCARFAIIQMEGGRTIAAPYRILRSSGPSAYTVTVERERLMNAPVVDIGRIDEFSSPEFSQRVYGYYNVAPEEQINIRESRTETNVTGESGVRERRGEREIQRGTERTRTTHGEAGVTQTPAPLGEKVRKNKKGQPAGTPSIAATPGSTPARSVATPGATPALNATPTPNATPSATPSPESNLNRPETGASPGASPSAERRREAKPEAQSSPSSTRSNEASPGAPSTPRGSSAPSSGSTR